MVRGARDIFGCYWNILAECRILIRRCLFCKSVSGAGAVPVQSRFRLVPTRLNRPVDKSELWSACLTVAGLNASYEMRVSRKKSQVSFHLSGFNCCV